MICWRVSESSISCRSVNKMELQVAQAFFGVGGVCLIWKPYVMHVAVSPTCALMTPSIYSALEPLSYSPDPILFSIYTIYA